MIGKYDALDRVRQDARLPPGAARRIARRRTRPTTNRTRASARLEAAVPIVAPPLTLREQRQRTLRNGSPRSRGPLGALPGCAIPPKAQTGTPQWWHVEEALRAAKTAWLRSQELEPSEIAYPVPLKPEELWVDDFLVRHDPRVAGHDVPLPPPLEEIAAAEEGPATIERPWHRWVMSKATGTPEERGRRLVAITRYADLQAAAGADLSMGRDVDLTDLVPDEELTPSLVPAARLTLDGSTGTLISKGLRVSEGKPPVQPLTYSVEDVLDARSELVRIEKALGREYRRTLDLALMQNLTFATVGQELFHGAKGKSAERRGVAAFKSALDALADCMNIPARKIIESIENAIDLVPAPAAESTPTLILPVINRESFLPISLFQLFPAAAPCGCRAFSRGSKAAA